MYRVFMALIAIHFISDTCTGATLNHNTPDGIAAIHVFDLSRGPAKARSELCYLCSDGRMYYDGEFVTIEWPIEFSDISEWTPLLVYAKGADISPGLIRSSEGTYWMSSVIEGTDKWGRVTNKVAGWSWTRVSLEELR